MLRADVVKVLGDFRLEADLRLDAGETLVLVGESGAGKTTLLNLLAGLADPDSGRIEIGGRTYFDSAGAVSVPACERNVGYVFQDYALFPHLSVADNVAFGLRAQGRSRRDVQRPVAATLERLGIGALATARPASLSGGQQQRVALARALVLEAELLLLDEPLAALDLQTRREIRIELSDIVAAAPGVTVFVTHSPFEAMAFGERIAVVENGRVVQLGSRDDLLRHPRTRYVAELMGLNFFHGTVVSAKDGVAEVRTAHGALHVVDVGAGEEVFVAVDPRSITLHTEAPRATAQNLFAGVISEMVPEPPFGESVRVILASEPPLVAEITEHAARTMALQPGMRVYASFKAFAARAYR